MLPHPSPEQTVAVRPDLTLYASLELSRATWLVTCLLPERDRISKYATPGGDGNALLGLLERMRARGQQLTDRTVQIVVIQEAGLDGFWVHRLLEANGIKAGAKLRVKPRGEAKSGTTGYLVNVGRSAKAVVLTAEAAGDIRIVPCAK